MNNTVTTKISNIKKRSIVLLLTYIFYVKKVGSTTGDLYILCKKRSIVFLLTYIFYVKNVNSTTVDLIFYVKKVNKVL